MKHLKKIWCKWKKVARKIGDFQARVLLTICYVLVVAPLGAMMAMIKKEDKLKECPGTYWLIKQGHKDTMESIRRQS